MRKRRTKARVGMVGLVALVLMMVGLGSASASPPPRSIWAESTGCETVTIFYDIGWIPYDIGSDSVVELPAFNAQGTVNGVVKNGNGVWSTEIVFTGVAPGLAVWSGSMWWDLGLPVLEAQEQGQYFDQGTVQVEPCPATTTTQPTVTTTQPTDTSSSTIAQVETDLPETGGSGFGLSLVVAGFVAALLGGVAVRAARIDD